MQLCFQALNAAHPPELAGYASSSAIKHSAQIPPSASAGYTILEALIATAITAIVGSGLWQLAASTRNLAQQSFQAAQPTCDAPSCSEITLGIECRCGDQVYAILR